MVSIGIGVKTSLMGAMMGAFGPIYGKIIDKTKHLKHHQKGYLIVSSRLT